VIVDAEKCVDILEGMEEVWPGARRCRDIVSDLLVVVKAKHFGGPSALEHLQKSHQGSSGPVPSETSQGKRKVPDDFDSRAIDARPRPRLEEQEHHPNPWTPQSSHFRDDRSMHNGYNDGPHQMDTNHSISHQRLSNVRTPVDHSEVRHGYRTHPVQHQQVMMQQGSMPPMKPMQSSPTPMPQQEPPRISLDLNALSTGREIDGLPFSGYDFLGGDLYALLGSVFRPPNEQIPQQFEENGQILWQAYGQGREHLGQEQQYPVGYERQPGPPR